MTSHIVLLVGDAGFEVDVGCRFQDAGRGGGLPCRKRWREFEEGVGNAEHRHCQQQPAAGHHHHDIAEGQPEPAALQAKRQRVQYGEADHRVNHQQRRGDGLAQHCEQPAGKAEREGGRQGRERHRRQFGALQVGPRATQPSRHGRDPGSQPEIEHQHGHGAGGEGRGK